MEPGVPAPSIRWVIIPGKKKGQRILEMLSRLLLSSLLTTSSFGHTVTLLQHGRHALGDIVNVFFA